MRFVTGLLFVLLLSSFAFGEDKRGVQITFPSGQVKNYSDTDKAWGAAVDQFAGGKADGTLKLKFVGPGAPPAWTLTKKGQKIHNNVGNGIKPDVTSAEFVSDFHKMFTMKSASTKDLKSQPPSK